MHKRPRGSDGPSTRHMAAFATKKQFLLKKAMELSVLGDCDVALIVTGPDGRMMQYSSMDMDKLLEEYAQACQKPHERYTNADLLKLYQEDGGQPDDVSTLALAKKRMLELDATAVPSNTPAELPVATAAPAIHVEGLKPAGFMDDSNYPVSPRSEQAYKDINAQLDKWVEQLNNSRGSQEAGPGPLSPGAGKRFKSLSVIVPENITQPILRRASAAGDTPPAAAAATAHNSSPGDGPSTSQDTHGLLRQHSQSISGGGLMGLSLPSPSTMLFGFPSVGGLFSSRGGLNLDLPMPDSSPGLGPGPGALEWPSTARARNLLPGFSDDTGSGEELSGDLMVTGRGIKPVHGMPSDRQEASSARSGSKDNEFLGLMVSGIKVSKPAGKDDFPGFAATNVEPSETPMQCQSASRSGAGIDLPLDV